MNRTPSLRTTCAMAVAALALAACSNNGGSSSDHAGASSSSAATASAKPAASGGHVKLAYVEWSSCTAATNVVKAALEQKGYTVDAVSVSGAAMYSAIANGDADATVCAWLPTTQANYYAKTKDRLDNLGPNMQGTKLGLVVPDYVSIDSIEQLKANADKFDDRIVGIDPGAGEMDLTQKVIKQYGLPLKLVAGSGATMTAALKSAIDEHKWIVVTGWTPHWMWARWKLKYLADPKNIYGDAESIDTLARKGLQTSDPGAYAILDGFHWTAGDMQQVMAAAREPGSDPASAAKQWVAAHPDKVDAWTGSADTKGMADTGTAQ
ncbi:glycine betaine ABC transporter substrate-binding protein [Oleiagrimonas soli]|uniref:Glycine betaine/proline transport system substrate-binding protein n=1 Tax=Oleiagrimonas soli TaxID=1543381 RepID=A0A099D087_9GAMM|nr:glycine betaine ABC transporter substrate-binding protein [Oleiagrimonas soli]KGI78685.1 glycine/betaine ABC transporter substrate-binding protein [Oleiagrimonas soli]MBB6183997.1 glycine betaine/proline transport system substrate-binding protein [Oleiagrimonas soli]